MPTIQELIANNPDILAKLGILPPQAPSTPIPMASAAEPFDQDNEESDEQSGDDAAPTSVSDDQLDDINADKEEQIDEDDVPKSQHHVADMTDEENQRLGLDRSPATVADSQDTPTPSSLAQMLNFGNGAPAGLSQEEKNRASYAELGAGLGGAASIIGSAMAKVPENKGAQEAFAHQQQDAAGILPQLQQQKAMTEDTDPNSKSSLALRGVLDRMGVKYSGTPSAAQLKLALPYVFKDMEAKQTAQARKDVAQYRADSLNQRYLASAEDKKTKDFVKMNADDEKEAAKVGKELNSLTASSRSALGLASTAKVKANRLNALLDDPDTTPQDFSAAATDLNAIIAGTATQGGAQHQEYNNLQMELTRYSNMLTSGAKAVNQPQVKQHIKNIANRMVQLSDNVIAHNSRIVKTAHPGWVQRNPDKFQDMLDAMNSGDNAGPIIPSGTPPPAGGKIKVSNGKETLMIDPADLPHAQTDGYNQVGQ